MQPSSSPSVFDTITASAFEFVLLFAAWMIFVSMTKRQEIVAGVFAAAIAAIADGIIKNAGFARFKPRAEWLPLIFWEAWYALDGTWAIMAALAKHIAGKESEAQFVSLSVEAGGDDAESWARRTLLTAYMTIPPNFIILGIDLDRQRMLVHQVSPTGVPLIAKKLGAREEGKIEARQAPAHAARDGVEP